MLVLILSLFWKLFSLEATVKMYCHMTRHIVGYVQQLQLVLHIFQI